MANWCTFVWYPFIGYFPKVISHLSKNPTKHFKMQIQLIHIQIQARYKYSFKSSSTNKQYTNFPRFEPQSQAGSTIPTQKQHYFNFQPPLDNALFSTISETPFLTSIKQLIQVWPLKVSKSTSNKTGIHRTVPAKPKWTLQPDQDFRDSNNTL